MAERNTQHLAQPWKIYLNLLLTSPLVISDNEHPPDKNYYRPPSNLYWNEVDLLQYCFDPVASQTCSAVCRAITNGCNCHMIIYLYYYIISEHSVWEYV